MSGDKTELKSPLSFDSPFGTSVFSKFPVEHCREPASVIFLWVIHLS